MARVIEIPIDAPFWMKPVYWIRRRIMLLVSWLDYITLPVERILEIGLKKLPEDPTPEQSEEYSLWIVENEQKVRRREYVKFIVYGIITISLVVVASRKALIWIISVPLALIAVVFGRRTWIHYQVIKWSK